MWKKAEQEDREEFGMKEYRQQWEFDNCKLDSGRN